MKHSRYRVLDPAAQVVAGAPVSPDRTVDLTAREARYPLDQGLIELASPEAAPEIPADPPHHPLDHDGDGRPGGSIPGQRRRRAPPVRDVEAQRDDRSGSGSEG